MIANRGAPRAIPRAVPRDSLRRRMTGPIWLILPTYNEAANLARVVASAMRELESCAQEGWRILIVDDASPDGTGRIADELAAENASVAVLHRRAKAGLGQAYLAGFRRALADGAEWVVEMDADFSHDPAYLPQLIAASSGADLVLGSRYVEGGGVSDWGILRRALSRGGCRYARAVLGVEVRDLTGGFKVINRAVLESIGLNSLRSQGYVFQVEVTYRAIVAGFRVREVPIVFRERRAGASKMSARIAFEAMLLVPRLRASARAAVAEATRSG
jgi:dolichol-phosphate mannosyltransferase